jgi:hypothetical protein
VAKKKAPAKRKNGRRAPATKERPKFRLSATMRNRLPGAQRADAEARLLERSGGLCELCGTALGGEIVPDHRTPVADDGADDISNLYLAHRSCNASRQHLPFEVAKKVVGFKVFAESNREVTFGKVLAKYVNRANQEISFREEAGRAFISFGGAEYDARIATDPATGVRYFFAEVPSAFIHDDTDIQPRKIMHAHVRKLTVEFSERPVHEPSNCRLRPTGPNTAKLTQFDGQHKTTAQILLGRDSVPVKIYLNPPQDMLQQLVIKVQQEIKKQPLTRSDTLAKLGDVIKRFLDEYQPSSGGPKSEEGLVQSQPTRRQQKEVRDIYLSELKRLVFFDPENRLAQALKPGEGQAPTTDKVIIDRIITPLISSGLLATDLEGPERDNERRAILAILNAIADEMLPEGWEKNPNSRARAQNFFYQASIGWWIEILTLAIRYVLRRLSEKRPLFIEPLSTEEESDVIDLVEKLCRWEVWSRKDADTLKALRSNTVTNVRAVFEGFDDRKLLRDAGL